jgi:hypothetical protein
MIKDLLMTSSIASINHTVKTVHGSKHGSLCSALLLQTPVVAGQSVDNDVDLVVRISGSGLLEACDDVELGGGMGGEVEGARLRWGRRLVAAMMREVENI